MSNRLLKKVYLIGFMGAGKSTAARKLARTCGSESIDTDFFVEQMCGKKVREIFDEVGEAGFRKRENDALSMISKMDKNLFVSCGGGIVLNKNNVEIMQDSGVVIHLYSDAYNGARRISDKSTRPLFNDVESAQAIFKKRLPLYEDAANYSIDTTKKGSSKVARELLSLLKKNGILIDSDKDLSN